MTHSSVQIQIAPEAVPTTPCWFGEVAIVAEILKTYGLVNLIEKKVQFARASFDQYDLIDFVAVLIGYALSGEPTLQAFYTRLAPFSTLFMALFDRSCLPHRSTLSRFLSALDQPSVDALRSLFQDDLVARTPFGSPAGGLWDRLGNPWFVIDVDGTKQAARQRALPQTSELPAPHRRFDRVCAKGYFARKRGHVGRTRTTVLQPYTHQWIGTFSGPGNGDYREELRQALQAITAYATAFALPLSEVIIRVDGLYGNKAPLKEILSSQCGAIGRSKEYSWLDLPEVQTRLQLPPDAQVTHPESGAVRDLYDCLVVPLTPQGPVVRLLVATHPASDHKPAIGVVRKETVYELFYTTLPPHAFTASDVLHLYLHRGSFETVLSDEDQEQDPDRWVSRSPCGQDCWQILSQWIWNLRLELGQQLSARAMRVMEFAPAQALESVQATEAAQVTEPAPALESVQATEAAQVAEPAPAVESVQAAESVSYGPPQWARRSFTKGFAGSDFLRQPDGTLRCPADHPLTAQERRPERNGSLRIVYSARLCHCRPCPLREQCQESGMTIKPRRVSAVFWPVSSSSSGPGETPQEPGPLSQESSLISEAPSPICAPFPVLWGDWERCSLRRRWFQLLRSQTVLLPSETVQLEKKEDIQPPDVQTRAQRAHWRLSWHERLARNARSSSAPPLTITVHGLPATFAQFFGFALVAVA